MNQLILIRGLPGSGKSTMATKMVVEQGYVHFEADQYFVEDGVYTFDYTRIKEAHMWCQVATRAALTEGKLVVVSNTFTQRWELQPYLDMVHDLGVVVTIVIATGDYRNIHGVPEEVIQRMKDRWED
jgi:predicted kinase